MLLEGITETQAATAPAEMVLVRIAYVLTDMPTPDEGDPDIEQNGSTSPVITASAPSARMWAADGLGHCRQRRPHHGGTTAGAPGGHPPGHKCTQRPHQKRTGFRASPTGRTSHKRDLMAKSAAWRPTIQAGIEDGALEIALDAMPTFPAVNNLSPQARSNKPWIVMVSNETGQANCGANPHNNKHERLSRPDPHIHRARPFSSTELIEVHKLAAEPRKSDAHATGARR